MSGFAAKNEHGVYTDRETIVLEAKGGRGRLAEIRLAHTEAGWRASHAFEFHTGNWWGQAGPITDHDKPHPSREAAIEAEAEIVRRILTRARLEPAMEPERSRILDWLVGLVPAQADLFGAAA